MLGGGGTVLGGGYGPRGFTVPRAYGESTVPLPLVNRQAHVKTFPSPNSFAGDNKPLVSFCELNIDFY